MRKIWSGTISGGSRTIWPGAALVGIISFANKFVGWQNALLIVPVMYLVYRSYQLYLDRLEAQKKRVEVEEQPRPEAEKRHVEEVRALHLRTIEGLGSSHRCQRSQYASTPAPGANVCDRSGKRS